MRNEKECVCNKSVSECVCSKIIKELPGLVGSGTPCIYILQFNVLLNNKTRMSHLKILAAIPTHGQEAGL